MLLTGQKLTDPPSRMAGGVLDEQPAKLHPTSGELDISVAPGALEWLLDKSHAVLLCVSCTRTTTRLSMTRVGVQSGTFVIAILPLEDQSGIVLFRMSLLFGGASVTPLIRML